MPYFAIGPSPRPGLHHSCTTSEGKKGPSKVTKGQDEKASEQGVCR